MDASNALAVTASALGIYQMNEEVKEANENKTNNVTEKGMRFMLLSILINFLWMIYQTNSLQSRMSVNLLKTHTKDLPHFRVKILECC